MTDIYEVDRPDDGAERARAQFDQFTPLELARGQLGALQRHAELVTAVL